ncbi:hypothetical protein EJB05_57721, partial [Eragrostis curvula]
MEPKPSPPPADGLPRRRGPKRKAREEAGALSPPPPKRRARERKPSDLPALPPPPRARAAPKPRRKPAHKKARRRSVKPQRKKEASSSPPPPPTPPPLPSLEQEVEAVLSRGAGVHIVPTFAGWFSWKEIHPIEKQTLATFFDGKSEKRTPETYLGIRNFIMKKFHFNPQVHLGSKDLSELSIGEMDARLEVLEFLAYWGLVNFHPFPQNEQECKLVDSKNNADAEEKSSLVEKLYQFESVQSYLVPVPNKADIASPAQAVYLLSEPTLAEDVVTSAESSVEYHCNSCSVDCSRKRYHCRTQVDFDLCSDCYNEGKFDEGMSQVDFILMDSAEVKGSGGTSWNDQETLLLLEALEIFNGNKWDDIAEHVATKNKEQCMLYLLQMPIWEAFLDDDFFNHTSQQIVEQAAAENVTKVPEKMEVHESAEAKESTGEKISKKANANSEETGMNLSNKNASSKKDTKNSDDLVAPFIVDELYKSSSTDPGNKKSSSDVNVSGERASNFVINVLRSAFEAFGHFPEKKDTASFTEAGNPVMALAAFLSGLVDHDDAVTSCHTSLRAILEISPALQLATRHCFILSDPPSEVEIPTFSVSPASTGNMHQNRDDLIRTVNDGDKDRIKKVQDAAFTSLEEYQELCHTNGSSVHVPQADAESYSTKDSDNRIDMVDNSDASEKISAGHNSISHSASPNDTDRNEARCIASQEDCKVTTEDSKERNSNKNIAADNDSIRRLQRAACTGISAAAVKAKFLADQEEYHIRQLAALVIQKQFQKVEAKMSFIAEVEHMSMKAREITKAYRNKLLVERNEIIASRRVAAMQSWPNQRWAHGTRLPLGCTASQHLTRP